MQPVVSGQDVHLQTVIELSEGKKNTLSGIDSPVILNRKIESSVILASGQSIIVGGLISEKEEKNTDYLPFGRWSVPVGKENINSRSELVVILNVSVIEEKEADGLFDKMSEKFKHQKFEKKRGKK